MPQHLIRLVVGPSDEAISHEDAIARQIVLPDEAKYLSSIAKVGQGGFGAVYALRFKYSTAEERDQCKTPNHVKLCFALDC